eukprot:m.341351 g.341351  ORF g.341351 m.341351 type:complete len:64 (-) comp27838_c0_seq18:480-671(-)
MGVYWLPHPLDCTVNKKSMIGQGAVERQRVGSNRMTIQNWLIFESELGKTGLVFTEQWLVELL